MPRLQRLSQTPLDAAIAAHQTGRLDEAESGYRAILRADPDDADGLHLLGLLLCDRGQPAVALPWIEQAIARQDHRAAFHNSRGRALAEAGRLAEAEDAYRRAWTLRPDTPEIANNLGCLLRAQHHPAALGWFRIAGRLAPGSPTIVTNLADALAEAGTLDECLAQFDRAVKLLPRDAGLRVRRGQALLRTGRLAEAEACIRDAIRIDPERAGAHNALGVVLERQGRGGSALCFEDAVRCDPHDPDALCNLGRMRLLDGRMEEARRCLDRAITQAPLHGAARWARCMAELPIVYVTMDEIEQARGRYEAALNDLVRWSERPEAGSALRCAIGSAQPFFLPAQGHCDRALMERYGALLQGLVEPGPTPRRAGLPAPGEKLRLGIVTGFACEHTVWRLMVKGWLTHLDRARFSVTLFHTGVVEDAETAVARRLADRFVGGPGVDLRAAVVAQRPHVLVYPELGMDPACPALAAERLAPVQCVAWGQPHTSGLQTIDFFLSGAAMEPPAASLHYTERLVALPRLGVFSMPQPVRASGRTRAAFGVRADAILFWCGQPLWKYQPCHDAVFARIAAEVADAQFLFIGFAKSPAATLRFRARIGRAFTALGLDPARHCVFCDSMDQADFLASVAASDIVLDSIGWSGGKSTLDMLAEAPVIVTHEGGLMRARHTAGILRCLGVTETIAGSVDRYVEIAVALARDPAARAGLRARIAAARGWLLDDLSPVRALEDFCSGAVRWAHGASLPGVMGGDRCM